MNNKNIKLAKRYIAKYLSLSNAAEFIRQHGEEGFGFEDIELNNFYLKSNKNVADKLNKEAFIYLKKYEELGIDINTNEIY